MDAGEDVFRQLEENVSRLHFLVSQIHETIGLPPPTALLQPASPTTTVLPQETAVIVAAATAAADTDGKQEKRRMVKKKAPDGTEHILAASALCQLAGPEGEGSSSNSSMADGGVDETVKTEDDSKLGTDAVLDDAVSNDIGELNKTGEEVDVSILMDI